MIKSFSQSWQIMAFIVVNPLVHIQQSCIEVVKRSTIFATFPQHIVYYGLEIGMEFENKKACMFAIQQYHIKRSLNYRVLKSENECYVIKCVNSNYKFKCRSSLTNNNSIG